jgi:hypothetical protein
MEQPKTMPALQASPVITSKNLPPQTPVQDVISDEQIVAKPLRSPNFINLKPRNATMSLFWGNRSVGEKESGLRYDQLIAMGFVPAKPDQVMQMNGTPCPPSICRDNRIMYGDLILLIMPRVDYVGALKFNEQSARFRVKKPGVAIQGDPKALQNADSRVAPSGAGFPNSPKISTYVPQLAEIDAKTADNSGPEVNLATK